MRTALIVIGIIVVVVGAILYYVPTQGAATTTTTTGTDGSTSRTTFSSITVPQQIALALAVIGLALFILGLVLPSGYAPRVRESYVERRTDSREGDGRRRVVHEHQVHNR